MTASRPDLERMFHEAHRLEPGPARWAALDAVFRHADAAEDLDFGFRARMSSMSDLHHSGEYARMLLAFSWCLATFDAHPEVTGEHHSYNLLWRYKWVVWEVTQFAGVTRERADGLLEDMQARYQAGGYSLHAVYQHRGLVAHHMGDLDAAGHWYEKMTTARRDSLSDCAACVPSGHVAYLAAAGLHKRAVEVGQPYSRGGCTEQPHWMLSELLVPYLRTDRRADAVAGHRTAYRHIRDSRHHLELVGLNVEFCGLSGNQAHALAIVEHHLPWLDRPSSPYAAMEFASASALVLRRLAQDGSAEAPVRRRSDDGTRHWGSTVAETEAELAALARGLAAEFDARNGNDYQSRRIEARLSAAPLVEDLPLTVLRGRPIAESGVAGVVKGMIAKLADLVGLGDRAGAARAQLDVAFALRSAGQFDDATEAAEEARRALDASGLRDDALVARYLLAELYEKTHDHGRMRALVDELLAEPRLPAGIPSRAALLEMGVTWGEPSAPARLVEAAAEFRAAGDREGETRCLRRAVTVIQQAGPIIPGVVARLDELVAEGGFARGHLADVQDHLCRLELLIGSAEAALARAERHQGLAPTVRARRSAILLRLGRLADAEQAARDVLIDDGPSWMVLGVIAGVMRAQGRQDELAAFAAEQGLDEYDVEELLTGDLEDCD